MKPERVRPARRIKVCKSPSRLRLTTHADAVFVVDRDHATRLDKRSLETVWRVPVERDSGPGFVEDSVLFLGQGGNFSGIDVADGRKLWGPTPLGSCRQWKGKVLGQSPLAIVDPTTGRIVRTLSSEDMAGDASVCGDIVAGVSIKGTTGDPVTAFHIVEERVLWKRDLIAEAAARAGSYDTTRLMADCSGTLLLGRKDWLYACAIESGSIRWDRRVTLQYLFPAVSEGRVYVLAVNYDEPAHLVSMNLETGEVIYDVPQPVIEPLDRPYRGVVQGGQIAFSTEKGRIAVFRREDGALVWWSEHDDTVFPPSFIDNRVLLPAIDGNLLVFEPPAA